MTIKLTKPKSETPVQLFEFLMRNGTNAEYPKKWQKIEEISLWQG